MCKIFLQTIKSSSFKTVCFWDWFGVILSLLYFLHLFIHLFILFVEKVCYFILNSYESRRWVFLYAGARTYVCECVCERERTRTFYWQDHSSQCHLYTHTELQFRYHWWNTSRVGSQQRVRVSQCVIDHSLSWKSGIGL